MTERRSWVLASHNAGKVREILELFEGLPVDLRRASELALAEPEETGTTFKQNAELKAIAADKGDRHRCALRRFGRRGRRARWRAWDPYGPLGRPSKETSTSLGAELKHGSRSWALTRVEGPPMCACFASPGRTEGPRCFRGDTRGTLVWPIRGELGAGFEPMFLPDGYAITYGEMTPEHRAKVNARAQAMRQLRESLFSPVAKVGT